MFKKFWKNKGKQSNFSLYYIAQRTIFYKFLGIKMARRKKVPFLKKKNSISLKLVEKGDLEILFFNTWAILKSTNCLLCNKKKNTNGSLQNSSVLHNMLQHSEGKIMFCTLESTLFIKYLFKFSSSWDMTVLRKLPRLFL